MTENIEINPTQCQIILDKYIPPLTQHSAHIEMMQEYAEWYAKQCLEIAAKCAMIEEHIPEEELYKYKKTPFIISGGYIRNEHWCNVNKDSILNIKLPDHV